MNLPKQWHFVKMYIPTLIKEIYVRMENLTPKRVVQGIVLVTTLWMLSGVAKCSKHVAPEEVKAANYKSIKSTAALREQTLRLNGFLKASEMVELRAEVDGKILRLAAKEGSDLKAGDVILEIDPKNKAELLAKTSAILKQRRIDYAAAKELFARKLNSEAALAEKEALFKTAEADHKAAELDLLHTKIIAPFDGYLDQVTVDVGNYVSPASGSLGVYMNRNEMLACASISEKYMSKMHAINNANVLFSDGVQAAGVVKFLSRSADSSTKTFTMKVKFANNILQRASGETVSVHVPYQQKMAHKIAKSALLLSEDGSIIVKTINEDKQVVDHQVEMIDEADDGVWVAGLPDKCEIITLGGYFLKAGTKIKA